MQLETFEKRMGSTNHTFTTNNTDDKSDDEMYILEGTDMDPRIPQNKGIMKSMDFKVTYEGANER